jgi:hypothetical protein
MKLFASLLLFVFITIGCSHGDKQKSGIVEIDENQFQIYNAAFTAGKLKIVKAKSIESGSYHPAEDEILVLDRLPKSKLKGGFNNLVRGVIISQKRNQMDAEILETLKISEALSIPFVYISGASKSDRFEKLEGKQVFFKVKDGLVDYTLMPLGADLYDKFDDLLKTRFSKFEITVDENALKTKRVFFDLNSKNSTEGSSVCGPKPLGMNVQDGFCIPFYYFDTFMRMNKRGSDNLREFALSQLKSLGESPAPEEIKEITDKINQAFMDAKISDRHIEEIRQKFLENFKEKITEDSYIFRGSSNVDDVPRLYLVSDQEFKKLTYKSLKNMKPEQIEDMIKKIWTSLYSFQNYSARRQFGVDESRVYMSVLVYNQSVSETAKPPLDAANLGVETPYFEKPILMLDPMIELQSHLDEIEYGPIGQSTRARYKFKFPLGMNFLDFKENYKDATIQTSDFYKSNQSLKIKNANVVSEGPWVKDSKSSGEETKTYRMFLETDHPYFKDLNISIDYTSYRKNGRVVSDNIVTLDQAKIKRLVHRRHYTYRSRDTATNLGADENKRYVAADVSVLNKANFLDFKGEKVYCYKNKKIAIVAAKDKNSDVKKATFFKGSEPLNLKKDLVVEGEFKVYGGPANLEQTTGGVFEQYSVFLNEGKESDLEEVDFLVFTDHLEPRKTVLRTFNASIKRLKQYTLDEDCSSAE